MLTEGNQRNSQKADGGNTRMCTFTTT